LNYFFERSAYTKRNIKFLIGPFGKEKKIDLLFFAYIERVYSMGGENNFRAQ